jgi:hypothetical protein
MKENYGSKIETATDIGSEKIETEDMELNVTKSQVVVIDTAPPPSTEQWDSDALSKTLPDPKPPDLPSPESRPSESRDSDQLATTISQRPPPPAPEPPDLSNFVDRERDGELHTEERRNLQMIPSKLLLKSSEPPYAGDNPIHEREIVAEGEKRKKKRVKRIFGELSKSANPIDKFLPSILHSKKMLHVFSSYQHTSPLLSHESSNGYQLPPAMCHVYTNGFVCKLGPAVNLLEQTHNNSSEWEKGIKKWARLESLKQAQNKASNLDYFSKSQLAVVKEKCNFVVNLTNVKEGQYEHSPNSLMIQLHDHVGIIIFEGVEMSPNNEMLLEDETALMFIPKKSMVVTRERIVGRPSFQEGRIINKGLTHSITDAIVINGTNFSSVALANVTVSSQAKYSLDYGIEKSIKLIPLVKSLIDGTYKFSFLYLVMRLAMLTISLVMKHIGKDGNSLMSGVTQQGILVEFYKYWRKRLDAVVVPNGVVLNSFILPCDDSLVMLNGKRMNRDEVRPLANIIDLLAITLVERLMQYWNTLLESLVGVKIEFGLGMVFLHAFIQWDPGETNIPMLVSTHECCWKGFISSYSLLNFVYDRGKSWEILFDARTHKLEAITPSLQICKQWSFFGIVGQDLRELNFSMLVHVNGGFWISILVHVNEGSWRMYVTFRGLLNFVFDRGKFGWMQISTLRTRLFEGVGIDRDLSMRVNRKRGIIVIKNIMGFY